MEESMEASAKTPNPLYKADSERRMSIKADEAKLNCRQTLRSCVTPKTVAGFIVWCALAATFGWLFLSGTLEDLQVEIIKLGIYGYFIFFGVLLIVAQPFGWGYQATTIAIGFVYGWEGLIVLQVGTQVGALITFFEVRYLARDFLKSRVNKMQPKLQLLVKKLEESATETWYSSFPFLIGIRQTPITFGLNNGIFALTDITLLRFYVTLVIGTMIEGPISINIGILLRQAGDLVEQNGDNSTLSGLKDQEEELQTISFVISVVITVLVLLATGIYGGWLVKKVSSQSEEEVIQEIVELDEHREEEMGGLGAPGSRSSSIVDSFKPLV